MNMKIILNKLFENQGYRKRELYNCNVERHSICKKKSHFQKLWPWVITVIGLGTVAAIGISISQLVHVTRYKFGLWAVANATAPATVISCYYNTPSSNSSEQLLPAHLQPRLCTHINVAFARLYNKSIHLEPSQHDTLRDVVKLKEQNPTLKVLLSVGGAGENHGFSDMVINHASRKIFIRSMKKILKDYNLDGIDLDWEFPVLHYQGAGVAARERQHFSQLLREIRKEYIREKKDYILSVALAAPQTIVDVAYDVDQINLYVDYANIMTYDFHYYTKFTPFTGFNSPLYARSTEELFMATFNINYTIHMYQSKGLDRNKIVVGIPTYGHSFKLVNAENPGVGSPAAGVGSLGGFVDYPAVCAFRAQHARDVTERFDAQARVPYLYRAAEWLSYDSARSVAAKAAFVQARRLRGAMLYSLNADDYRGRCAASAPAFPLTRSVAAALREPSPSHSPAPPASTEGSSAAGAVVSRNT